jgi:hypothetical protein
MDRYSKALFKGIGKGVLLACGIYLFLLLSK